MKTAGQILKEARIEKGLNFEEISLATKIQPVYLQALEEDAFEKLPSLTSGRGFLKNYAEYLGLSSESILAVFRRDYKEINKEDLPRKDLIGRRKFVWMPATTTVAALIIMVLLFIAYLIWQYRSLTSAPYY